MPQSLPIRVVRLTPPGRGAVATMLIEGPGAVGLVDSHFQSRDGLPLASYDADRLVIGRFGAAAPQGAPTQQPDHPTEEVVVRRRSDSSVEICCHGGYAADRAIEDALIAGGGRSMGWRDWVGQAHEDPITAAAHAALADARTQRTAAVLLDQYQGALRRAFDEIDAALDQGDLAAAREKIDALLARGDFGRHLTEPWQVVLAGEPNVGKSSLTNAMMGYARAIVHETPGTTRDVVTAVTAFDGWPVQLADTAGLGPGNDATERAGVELALKTLAAADRIVLVFDSARPWTAPDTSRLTLWPEAIVVHNKSDLPPASGDRPPGISTSAVRGDGIDTLMHTIAKRLVPEPPLPSTAVPFTAEQIVWLEQRRAKCVS